MDLGHDIRFGSATAADSVNQRGCSLCSQFCCSIHDIIVGSPILRLYSTRYFKVVRWMGFASAVGAGSSLPASMMPPRELRVRSASIFFWTSVMRASLVAWLLRAEL